MLINWCEAGGQPSDFWRQTPRTILAMIRGYRKRRGWQAWHGAILPRADKVPDLHDMMDMAPPPEDLEAAAKRRLASLRAWKRAIAMRNARMGIDAPAQTETAGNIEP